MLLIETVALQPGTHTLSLQPAPSDLDLTRESFSHIEIRAQLDYHDLDPRSRRLYLRYTVEATAHLVCDRTLVPFDEAVRGEHTLLYVPPGSPLMADDEEVRELPDGRAPVDIADAVRETLMLALPMRRVAPEARDQEIETTFGALTTPEGTSIDPRWEALLGLADAADNQHDEPSRA